MDKDFSLKQDTLEIDEWMKRFVLNQPSLNEGDVINCYDINGDIKAYSMNRIGILFEKCRIHQQDNLSNCLAGSPVSFVDIVTVFPPVFNCLSHGYLDQFENLNDMYIIPLCQLEEYPDMKFIMLECCSEFIYQNKGDNITMDSDIANALSTTLGLTIFSLCEELTTDESVSDFIRMTFLIVAIRALIMTSKSVAKALPDCDKIFRFIPYIANHNDIFQSLIMSHIFDEKPNLNIRIQQIGISITRYFQHHGWNASFIEIKSAYLIGLFLIIPLLNELIDSDLSPLKLIEKIFFLIDRKINTIMKNYSRTNYFVLYIRTKQPIVHLQNKQILRGFINSVKYPLISIKYIDNLYDAVINKHINIPYTIGITLFAPFERNISSSDEKISQTHLVNSENRQTSIPSEQKNSRNFVDIIGGNNLNFPIMTNMKKYDKMNSKASYISSNPSEWTGISLIPGEYLFSAKPLGISTFHHGDNQGKGSANFWLTYQSEKQNGLFPGYSGTGLYYDPNRDKFLDISSYSNFDTFGTFIIKCTEYGILFKQKKHISLILSNGSDTYQYPTIYFKFCKITVEYVSPMQISISKDLMIPSPVDISKDKSDYVKKVIERLKVNKNTNLSLKIIDKETVRASFINNSQETITVDLKYI